MDIEQARTLVKSINPDDHRFITAATLIIRDQLQLVQKINQGFNPTLSEIFDELLCDLAIEDIQRMGLAELYGLHLEFSDINMLTEWVPETPDARVLCGYYIEDIPIEDVLSQRDQLIRMNVQKWLAANHPTDIEK